MSYSTSASASTRLAYFIGATFGHNNENSIFVEFFVRPRSHHDITRALALAP